MYVNYQFYYDYCSITNAIVDVTILYYLSRLIGLTYCSFSQILFSDVPATMFYSHPSVSYRYISHSTILRNKVNKDILGCIIISLSDDVPVKGSKLHVLI